MEVYLVWHTHINEELIGGEDIKLIGVYSSAEGANLAVERAGCLNGFKVHISVKVYHRFRSKLVKDFLTGFSH